MKTTIRIPWEEFFKFALNYMENKKNKDGLNDFPKLNKESIKLINKNDEECWDLPKYIEIELEKKPEIL